MNNKININKQIHKQLTSLFMIFVILFSSVGVFGQDYEEGATIITDYSYGRCQNIPTSDSDKFVWCKDEFNLYQCIIPFPNDWHNCPDQVAESVTDINLISNNPNPVYQVLEQLQRQGFNSVETLNDQKRNNFFIFLDKYLDSMIVTKNNNIQENILEKINIAFSGVNFPDYSFEEYEIPAIEKYFVVIGEIKQDNDNSELNLKLAEKYFSHITDSKIFKAEFKWFKLDTLGPVLMYKADGKEQYLSLQTAKEFVVNKNIAGISINENGYLILMLKQGNIKAGRNIITNGNFDLDYNGQLIFDGTLTGTDYTLTGKDIIFKDTNLVVSDKAQLKFKSSLGNTETSEISNANLWLNTDGSLKNIVGYNENSGFKFGDKVYYDSINVNFNSGTLASIDSKQLVIDSNLLNTHLTGSISSMFINGQEKINILLLNPNDYETSTFSIEDEAYSLSPSPISSLGQISFTYEDNKFQGADFNNVASNSNHFDVNPIDEKDNIAYSLIPLIEEDELIGTQFRLSNINTELTHTRDHKFITSPKSNENPSHITFIDKPDHEFDDNFPYTIADVGLNEDGTRDYSSIYMNDEDVVTIGDIDFSYDDDQYTSFHDSVIKISDIESNKYPELDLISYSTASDDDIVLVYQPTQDEPRAYTPNGVKYLQDSIESPIIETPKVLDEIEIIVEAPEEPIPEKPKAPEEIKPEAPSCTDKCDTEGATVCGPKEENKNEIFACVRAPTSCLVWRIDTTCKPNQICKFGVCIEKIKATPCPPPPCTYATLGCDGETRWFCSRDDDGCTFKQAYPCSEEEICMNGRCVHEDNKDFYTRYLEGEEISVEDTAKVEEIVTDDSAKVGFIAGMISIPEVTPESKEETKTDDKKEEEKKEDKKDKEQLKKIKTLARKAKNEIAQITKAGGKSAAEKKVKELKKEIKDKETKDKETKQKLSPHEWRKDQREKYLKYALLAGFLYYIIDDMNDDSSPAQIQSVQVQAEQAEAKAEQIKTELDLSAEHYRVPRSQFKNIKKEFPQTKALKIKTANFKKETMELNILHLINQDPFTKTIKLNDNKFKDLAQKKIFVVDEKK